MSFWVIALIVVMVIALRAVTNGAKTRRQARQPATVLQTRVTPSTPLPPRRLAPPRTRPIQPEYAATYRPDEITSYLPSRNAAPTRVEAPPVPARTAPTPSVKAVPAAAEDSAAISSSALNTTLSTTYQPSSLITSTRSSLSSSLFDSPASAEAPSVLEQVSVPTLPPEIEKQVNALLRRHREVEAVRTVIDQLDVSLLEATNAVRSYDAARKRAKAHPETAA